MTQDSRRLGRRSLFALGAGASWASHRPARADAPESATLLVAGPETGASAQWAASVGAQLGRFLPQASAIRPQTVGGADGIAAANRFATAAAPDGNTLLAFSAAAAQARAAGDSRARFDPLAWAPVCGASLSVLLAGRGPLPRRGTTLRLGLSNPDSAEGAALMALDAMGVAAAPVFGIAPAMAEAALAQGAVDAALLSGPNLPARAAALGVMPWIAAELPGGARDPAMAEVLTLSDALGAAPGAVLAACRIGFAGFGTRGVVVLPALTPAAILVPWRQAGLRWTEAQDRDAGDGIRALGLAPCRALMAALCPAAEAIGTYREWLARRLNWRAA